MTPITFSIDVTLLDKSRFKHITRQSGAPAIFCDMIILPNKEGTDRFGNDGIVKQQSSKEERLESKVEMPILGNAKKIVAKAPAPAPAAPAASNESEDNIPW
jgi:hypothetical protein